MTTSKMGRGARLAGFLVRVIVFSLFALSVVVGPVRLHAEQIIDTVAGPQLAPEPARSASLGLPAGLAISASGTIYFADSENNRVRKLRPYGKITTVAGNASLGFTGDGGPAIGAALAHPSGVALDSSGRIYIADTHNHRIRRVDSKGVIHTIAGGSQPGDSGDGGDATRATLRFPSGVAVDGAGNVYVADFGNHRIRKIDRAGVISTIAGTGLPGYSGDDDGTPATSCTMRFPYGLALDNAGNLLFSDSFNQRIRRVNTDGTVTRVAGDGRPLFFGDGGPAGFASFMSPRSIAVDADGNVYVADCFNQRIRKIDTTGIIRTVAGHGLTGSTDDGIRAVAARLMSPMGVAVDTAGTLYLADTFGRRLRWVTANGIIGTVAGSGSAFSPQEGTSALLARFVSPTGVSLDNSGDFFIADAGDNRIRKVDAGGLINTIAGNGDAGYAGDGGDARAASLYNSGQTAIDALGNLFIVDTNNHRIRKVDSSGVITTVAGDGTAGFSGDGGPAVSARLNSPYGIAVDDSLNLYIADTYNCRIRMVDASGLMSTVAGNGVQGYDSDGIQATSAALNLPRGVALDASRNLLIADSYNHRIRKVSGSRYISTIAGNGTKGFSGDGGPGPAASLDTPHGITVGASGNIFIADTYNFRVRKLDSTGAIFTVAGNGDMGFSGDGGLATAANLGRVHSVAAGLDGSLFIADAGNFRVRKVFEGIPVIPTVRTVCALGCDYSSIQPAIDASRDSDTVRVRPGTYYENIDFKGKAVRVESFLGSQVTAIDGGTAGSVVTFAHGETAGSVLAGFAIQHGSADLGGGMHLDGASPTITDCIIRGNVAFSSGGAMYLGNGASPHLDGLQLANNTATVSGGGLYIGPGGSPSMDALQIEANVAHGEGGGIHCDGGSPSISRSRILGNSAVLKGAGVSIVANGHAVFDRVAVGSNRTSGTGGGIDVAGNSTLVLSNSLLSNNSGLTDGGAVRAEGSSVSLLNVTVGDNWANRGGGLFVADGSLTAVNCILWNNGQEIELSGSTIDVSYCDVKLASGIYPGDGNINADPMFEEPGSDYRLRSGSPCLDAGTMSHGASTDLADVSRPLGSGMDMGAYELDVDGLRASFSQTNGNGHAPLSVSFTDLSQPADSVLSWQWDFGDGAADSERNPTHVYSEDGVYDVTLKVTDTNGKSASTTRRSCVTVKDGALRSDFLVEPAVGKAPLEVVFYHKSTRDDITGWYWDFGDGEAGNEPNPAHVYSNAGTYSVVLRVTTGDGRYDETTKTDIIHVVEDAAVLDVCPSGCSYDSIQAAITAASEGDRILVDDGAYFENLSFLGKAISLQSVGGPTKTVIDGGAAGSVVRFVSGEGPGSLLEGFTLQNGHAELGGGVLVGPTSSPTVKNCVISSNQASIAGGGIAVTSGSKPNLINIRVSDNSARSGGGIACLYESSPFMTSLTIENNQALVDGGGVFTHLDSSPLIAASSILNNSAVGTGGGLLADKGGPTLYRDSIQGNTALDGGGVAFRNASSPLTDRCKIIGNSATGDGGGVYVADTSSPEWRSTVIANNQSKQGGAMYWTNVSSPVVSFSTLSGNSASLAGVTIHGKGVVNGPEVSNSILWDIQEGGSDLVFENSDSLFVRNSDLWLQSGEVYPGAGNLGVDPLFLSPGTDLRLSPYSPCIDKGEAADGPLVDVDGNERPKAGTYDMGAYEASSSAPVANSQDLTTKKDRQKSVALSATDYDGDPVTLTVTAGPSNGSLTGGIPNLTYTPNTGYLGPDSFTFKANDGTFDSLDAQVRINVVSNQAPSAANGDETSDEDCVVNGALSGSDPDEDALTYALVGNGNMGNATITDSVTGAFVYEPNPDASGTDSFTFKISDGEAESNVATVTLHINPVNDAPVASDKSAASDEDASVGITLTGSDADGDTLSFQIKAGPSHGGLSGAPPNLTYVPARDYNGPDSFTFEADDGHAASNTATVTIQISPVNDAPSATAQSVAADEDTPVSFTLAGSDPEADPLSFVITRSPYHGSVSGAPPNVVYTPVRNYRGHDSFTFKANDGKVDSAAGVVSITVSPVNDAPRALRQSVSVNQRESVDIMLAATDVDGDALTYTIVCPPARGFLCGLPPNLVYRALANQSGADSFTFKANDGALDSNTATVKVSITAVNDPPIADAGPDQEVEGEAVVRLSASNSTDLDDGIAGYHWTQTGGPTVSLSEPSSSSASFTAPQVGPNGACLTFAVSVKDLAGNESQNKCIVNVRSVNTPPTADAGPDQQVSDGRTVKLDGTGSTDPDGSIAVYRWTQVHDPRAPLAVLSDPAAAQPTFSVPQVGRDGASLVFRLTVMDEGGLKAQDTCVVNVLHDNLPPTAHAGRDKEVNEMLRVALDGSRSTDTDTGIAFYRWTQTGGPPVTLTNHDQARSVFTTPDVGPEGARLVFKLNVTDYGNLQSEDERIMNVLWVNHSPEVEGSPIGPSRGIAGGAYRFAASAADPDGDAMQYRFDWGDGMMSSYAASSKWHTWLTPGVFCVKVQAKDCFGVESPWSACAKILIE